MKTQKIKAFDKEIEVKELTIGQLIEVQKMDINDFVTVVKIVSMATGIPEEEIKSFPTSYLDDINNIVEIAMGTSKGK